MSSTNITIERMKLSTLLRAIDERRFAIPKLQREFVWDGPKAAKLLDSIVRGMPIGTVMIWPAPRAQRLHLRTALEEQAGMPLFRAEERRVRR